VSGRSAPGATAASGRHAGTPAPTPAETPGILLMGAGLRQEDRTRR
jgi:hypothetical protein